MRLNYIKTNTFNFLDKLDLKSKIEKVNTKFWLVLIFSIYYLGFIPNDNEEVYLQLAKYFIDPNWIKDSFMLSGFSGNTFLYNCIVGVFLNLFSFEVVTFLFRFILIMAFSYVLSEIYKKIKFNNLCIMVQLIFLFFDRQSFFGGSWMFVTVEPKGFAYFFALLALYQIMNKKDYLAMLFAVIATYFHVLVGFFMFSYIILTMVSLRKISFENIKDIALKSFVYIVLVSPFIVYLMANVIVDHSLKPDSNWIMSYYRNPHHTAILKSFDYFYKNSLFGVLSAIIALIILVSLKRQRKNTYEINVLTNFGILSLLFTLILVPLSYFDKTGVFLKYYPYRINTVSTFIFTLLFTKWIYDSIKNESLNRIYLYSILFISLPVLLVIGHRLNESLTYFKPNELNEVCYFIRDNTEKDAVIFSFNDDFKMTRKMDRERFISQKTAPPDFNKIHEWYYRVEAKKNLQKNLDSFPSFIKKYNIDYFVSEEKNDQDYLKMIHQNKSFYLYKIVK